jgi:hypothetical protein
MTELRTPRAASQFPHTPNPIPARTLKYFSWNNERFEISQVTDRWYQGETNPEYPVSNYFKVETTCGVYIIKHNIENDRWYLCQ